MVAKDFKVEFPVEILLHSLGNINFWYLQSFLILKHYLSMKFCGSKCLQEIVSLCQFFCTIFSYTNVCTKILPILYTLPESLSLVFSELEKGHERACFYRPRLSTTPGHVRCGLNCACSNSS